MTYADVINQIKHMSLTEQQAVLRELQRTVQLALQKEEFIIQQQAGLTETDYLQFAHPTETPAQRAQRLSTLPTAEELTGILATDSPAPTSQQIKEEYIHHLIQKYQ
ncbi:MAG: hypothetical protein OHK0052_07260 [Anaerolineales bacterium]